MLLHGFLSSRAQWLANLPGLQEFCTPVTIELWGHGRSPMPNNPDTLHPLAYVEQFERIRTAIGADRWYVVGQSFGAGLTLRYALEHPDVFFGTAFCNSNSSLEMVDGGNQPERTKQIKDILLGGRPLTELPIHPLNAKRLPDATVKALVEDAALLQADAMVQSLKHTREYLSVRNEFSSLKVPTLLINGVWEKHFQHLAKFAKDALASLEEVQLQGGHAINAEQADGFNSAVKRHFESCRE